MGMRALRKGVVMATRTKKTYIFVAFFVALTVLSIQSVNNIHTFDTDRILDIRGYVFEPNNLTLKSDFENTDLGNTLPDISSYARGIYIIYGAELELGPGIHIGILWMEPYRNIKYDNEIPWVIHEIKPTKIVEGRSLDFSAMEAIVGENFEVFFPLGTSNITVSFKTGEIGFISGGDIVKIKIVGVSSESFSGFKLPESIDSKSIIFTTYDAYLRLSDLGVVDTDNIYVTRVIVTAKGGSVYKPWTIGQIEENKDRIRDGVTNIEDFHVAGPAVAAKEYMSAVSMTIVSFLLTLLIGVVYAIMLISFRKFDIATLRAIGWGASHIRALAIGEFSITIVLGYIIGAIIGAIMLVIYDIPMTLYSFLGALITVVISMIMGLLAVYKRVLGIPPMEAFRAR